jgi:HEAT repeat protein
MTACACALALLIAADPAPEQLAKARAELASETVETRRAAVKRLSHSDLSPHLAAELIGCLRDKDDEVRAAAATVLGTLGAKSEAAVPVLVAQLEKDTFKEARETAARALGRLGRSIPTDRTAVPALKKAAADDPDPVTRAVAHGALAMLDADPAAQVAALRKYLASDDPLVRMKAAHAAGMIGTAARAAAPDIAAALAKDTDAHHRGYIARALGNTGDPASLPALEKALQAETDPGAKAEMRGAIQKLKQKS